MVRIKHRYLVANILTASTTNSTTPAILQFHSPIPSHVTIPLLLSHLRSSMSALFGDYGLGVTSSSLKMIYFSPATSTFIIRCPRAHFRLVWAALTYMERLPAARRGEEGVACVMRVVRVSGTIKKAEEDVLRRARRAIVGATMAMDGKGNDLLKNLFEAQTKTNHRQGDPADVAGIGDLDEGEGEDENEYEDEDMDGDSDEFHLLPED